MPVLSLRLCQFLSLSFQHLILSFFLSLSLFLFQLSFAFLFLFISCAHRPLQLQVPCTWALRELGYLIRRLVALVALFLDSYGVARNSVSTLSRLLLLAMFRLPVSLSRFSRSLYHVVPPTLLSTDSFAFVRSWLDLITSLL